MYTHDLSRYKTIRRNGEVVDFEPSKISVAMTKAFLAVAGGHATTSAKIRDQVTQLTDQVVHALLRRKPDGGPVHIEDIQDQVELVLMRAGEQEVAQAYVQYREERAQARAARGEALDQISIHFTDETGKRTPLEVSRLRETIVSACAQLPNVEVDSILMETLRNLYDGISQAEINKSAILAARSLVEQDPAYDYVTARLLLNTIRLEILGEPVSQADMAERYPHYFPQFIKKGIQAELLDPRLGEFDLDQLGQALVAERDLKFGYLGLQTLYDRYFLHIEGRRIEMPQAFFMRVAMGLALNEVHREERAIEFYSVLSQFDFMSSTPTLFNSGSIRSQLSSCYLTTVPDDLDGIYEAIKENALLSKFAGGLGNDWTSVRSMGSHIKGTNGKSQGVVPFLKVVNDTAVAVNQCFAPTTRVFTAKGLKEIQSLKKGDLVLGQSGAYREVQDRMVYNQTDAMLSVQVKHSLRPLEVTGGHPFFALQGVRLGQAHHRTLSALEKGTLKADWVDADQLAVGDFIAQVIPTEIVPVQGITEKEAYLYGVLLGDGHLTSNGFEWGVSGNPQRDGHLAWVRAYLEEKGIHFWETQRGETYAQIHWATGQGVVRCGTTGRFIEAGAPALPFTEDDLYTATRQKHIAPRFAHLPKAQTLALLQGLIDTDGGISRGKEIYFTTTSEALAEGVRYQCLRLGVPVSGQYRERDNAHTAQRSDGSDIVFKGTTHSYDLRIPAIAELAERVGCKALTKKNWIEWKGKLFSRIRALAPITPVPFVVDLKVEGDVSYMTTAGLAHNGGKRKGAVCTYLETWHADIEEFLELRKNTGDDRRRTHDMNTANWIPDLFMKRVMNGEDWSLFSPSECPDLHDRIGQDFERAYVAYEEKAARGEMKVYKKIPALALWRKMLTMLFETGHPWITFKDPCNLRSPQQHIGRVHSSNLCTEICLNTNDQEIAVCNLGSVNLANHLVEGQLDQEKLQKTIRTAMRMLDNVIDINFYPVKKARTSNLQHRPVGLGIMGFQDCLHLRGTPYASEEAVEFADETMEMVAYYTYWASTELAEERGKYPSYKGSLWDKGILPHDSINLLASERGGYLEVDRSERLAWNTLRQRIQQVGMRNSNCIAIAPTATIANIIGVSASIEPTYQNLFVKSNLSGEFTVINEHLVRELKKRDLWDEVMVADLKYFDGSLGRIDRVPAELRQVYATAFEMDPKWLIEAASRRQKWIDQAQSLNIYMAGASGKKLDELYKLAWVRGLKTTYYLRTLAASSAEKSTGQGGELNAVKMPPSTPPALPATDAKFCSIDNPDCESCQ